MSEHPQTSQHPHFAAVAWCWLAHGVLLVLLTIMCWLSAPIIERPEWADAMGMLGFERLIGPARRMWSVIGELSPWMATVGCLCTLGALGVLRRRFRAPAMILHGLAISHIPLIPWLTWFLHRAMVDQVPDRTALLISSVITVVLCEAILFYGILVVHRSSSR